MGVGEKHEKPPEAYFPPSAICALGNWVPEKFKFWPQFSSSQRITYAKWIRLVSHRCSLSSRQGSRRGKMPVVLPEVALEVSPQEYIITVAIFELRWNLICGGGGQKFWFEGLFCQFAYTVHSPDVVVLVIEETVPGGFTALITTFWSGEHSILLIRTT